METCYLTWLEFKSCLAVTKFELKYDFFFFFDKLEILFNKEQNYTGRERASALTTETKQEGPNPTSKEPK